eukprot:1272387-Lingulodinium_polyedra.AAC.1
MTIDTRAANLHFKPPWHSELPTAASWAGLDVPEEADVRVAQCDVSTAFYWIRAPDGMREFFVLPSIEARRLRAFGVALAADLDDALLVSPMLE